MQVTQSESLRWLAFFCLFLKKILDKRKLSDKIPPGARGYNFTLPQFACQVKKNLIFPLTQKKQKNPCAVLWICYALDMREIKLKIAGLGVVVAVVCSIDPEEADLIEATKDGQDVTHLVSGDAFMDALMDWLSDSATFGFDGHR